ncbi:hypothetical protein MTO96_016151 [Rhipicephalus appendiculatus]
MLLPRFGGLRSAAVEVAATRAGRQQLVGPPRPGAPPEQAEASPEAASCQSTFVPPGPGQIGCSSSWDHLGAVGRVSGDSPRVAGGPDEGHPGTCACMPAVRVEVGEGPIDAGRRSESFSPLPRRSLSRRLRLMASPSGFLVLAAGRRRASSSVGGGWCSCRVALFAVVHARPPPVSSTRCMRVCLCDDALEEARWRRHSLCARVFPERRRGCLCGCGTRTCPWCLPPSPLAWVTERTVA